MPKKFRDYLFLFFILVFLVATGLISLYASGYKINWGWPPRLNRFLIKTGLVIVDSVPRGATIYLNDQRQTEFSLNPWAGDYLTTNAKIQNVLPGEYTLRLELTGYWPLTKKISVYSGQSTYLKDINLFRSDQARWLAGGATTSPLQLSPSRKYLYAPAEKKIITIKTGQVRNLPTSDANNQGQWLTAEDKIMLAGHFFAPEAADDVDYQALIGAQATDWYYDAPTKRLYYQNKSALSYLDIAAKTSTLLLSGNWQTYQPRDEKLFVVGSDGDKTFLRKFSRTAANAEQEISLPTVARYRFAPANNQWLTLYDDQNKTLYLFNPDNLASSEKTINNVSDWQWLDGTTLIYNNRWEIYLVDLRLNNTVLLTRVGEEIKKLAWNKNRDYLIFATADSLNVYDQKIGLITKIFQATQIAAPVLDDKTDTLYFWAEAGGQSGIYSLLLK